MHIQLGQVTSHVKPLLTLESFLPHLLQKLFTKTKSFTKPSQNVCLLIIINPQKITESVVLSLIVHGCLTSLLSIINNQFSNLKSAREEGTILCTFAVTCKLLFYFLGEKCVMATPSEKPRVRLGTETPVL